MMEMADLCHLSPSYFSRTFNKETGESFVNYISSRRIQLAKELLLETGKSISQIAEEVGYDNISHFTAVFKRTEGITPSAYRSSKKRKTTRGSASVPPVTLYPKRSAPLPAEAATTPQSVCPSALRATVAVLKPVAPTGADKVHEQRDSDRQQAGSKHVEDKIHVIGHFHRV